MEEFLSTRYASATSKYVCEYCGFVAKNAAAKSAHLRGCVTKKNKLTKNKGEVTEIIEVNTHPWFVGVQFHPEYQSSFISPHPLFVSFLNAGLLNK